MIRVSNQNIKFIQSCLVIATAYWAGRERVLKHLPDTNRLGLLVAATCGSALTMIPNEYKPLDHFIRNNPATNFMNVHEDPFEYITFLNMTDAALCFSLGAGIANVLNVLSSRKIHISDIGTARSCTAAAGICGIVNIPFCSIKRVVYNKYKRYNDYPDLWNTLDAAIQEKYARDFFDLGLDLISSWKWKSECRFEVFKPLKPFGQATRTELEWYVSIQKKKSDFFSASETLDLHKISIEKGCALECRLSNKIVQEILDTPDLHSRARESINKGLFVVFGIDTELSEKLIQDVLLPLQLNWNTLSVEKFIDYSLMLNNIILPPEDYFAFLLAREACTEEFDSKPFLLAEFEYLEKEYVDYSRGNEDLLNVYYQEIKEYKESLQEMSEESRGYLQEALGQGRPLPKIDDID